MTQELQLFTQWYGRTCSREPDSPGLAWGIKAHRSEFFLFSFLLAALCKPVRGRGLFGEFLESAPSCPSPGEMAGSICPVSSCCFWIHHSPWWKAWWGWWGRCHCGLACCSAPSLASGHSSAACWQSPGTRSASPATNTPQSQSSFPNKTPLPHKLALWGFSRPRGCDSIFRWFLGRGSFANILWYDGMSASFCFLGVTWPCAPRAFHVPVQPSWPFCVMEGEGESKLHWWTGAVTVALSRQPLTEADGNVVFCHGRGKRGARVLALITTIANISF